MTTENVTATGDQKIAALIAANKLPVVVPQNVLYASLNQYQAEQVYYAYLALLQYQDGLGIVPSSTIPTPLQQDATDDAQDPTVLS